MKDSKNEKKKSRLVDSNLRPPTPPFKTASDLPIYWLFIEIPKWGGLGGRGGVLPEHFNFKVRVRYSVGH